MQKSEKFSRLVQPIFAVLPYFFENVCQKLFQKPRAKRDGHYCDFAHYYKYQVYILYTINEKICFLVKSIYLSKK